MVLLLGGSKHINGGVVEATSCGNGIELFDVGIRVAAARIKNAHHHKCGVRGAADNSKFTGLRSVRKGEVLREGLCAKNEVQARMFINGSVLEWISLDNLFKLCNGAQNDGNRKTERRSEVTFNLSGQFLTI